jgi:hypothetical protein
MKSGRISAITIDRGEELLMQVGVFQAGFPGVQAFVTGGKQVNVPEICENTA